MRYSENRTAEPVKKTSCYHCGDDCNKDIITYDGRSFCCEGCKLVYDLLKENSLCNTYYRLNQSPGIKGSESADAGKYEYLDNPGVSKKLVRFSDDNQTYITFFIPSIHCSSCIWLLENLHRINEGVISSKVNFTRKEADIGFNPNQVKLSEIAALLTHIGYEPLINLDAVEENHRKPSNRKQIVKIGIAGFGFGNIMMLSFPEYFSMGNFHDQVKLPHFFAYLNLVLSLPVFFYSASGFFTSAWKSLRHKYLNIDAPIALAILVTFSRSLYEILSGSGAGYMDSMTGIVFFMLIGRFFQDKTYQTMSFERDYKSFFPLGVTVKDNGKERSQPVSALRKGDHIIIRNNEIIPADSILLSSSSHIDYSFITGESGPVRKSAGDLIYAGGRQLEGSIELEVDKPVSTSYLTGLWNRDTQQQQTAREQGYMYKINKYFTITVLILAAVSALYWLNFEPSRSLDAMTAVLIVACPCGLLLTATFANGNMLRILARNGFYLKNSDVIDKLTLTDTIVFDKTGTITHGSDVKFFGRKLQRFEKEMAGSLAAQSSHPLSRIIRDKYVTDPMKVEEFEEFSGKGIKGVIDGHSVMLGSAKFISGSALPRQSTRVFYSIDGAICGYFHFENAYRDGLQEVADKLRQKYRLEILSGDNDSERKNLENIFGTGIASHFNCLPGEKKAHIRSLQDEGRNVVMIGDGLNDAVALQQGNVGIAVSDDTNTFSPSCDAIMHGPSLGKLPAFLSFAKAGKMAIIITFSLSLVYNLIGLSFAVQGTLSPVIAAILMPASSISIVILAALTTGMAARLRKL